MIISHGVGAERRVILADANPAIGALPVATLASLAETGGASAALGSVPAQTDSAAARPAPDAARDPRTDLGPPPARLDRRAARNRAELTVPSRPAGPPPDAG